MPIRASGTTEDQIDLPFRMPAPSRNMKCQSMLHHSAITVCLLVLAPFLVKCESDRNNARPELDAAVEAGDSGAFTRIPGVPSRISQHLASFDEAEKQAIIAFYRENDEMQQRQLERLEATLAARGLQRLPDSLLVQRAILVSVALNRMEIRNCAQFFAGPDDLILGRIIFQSLNADEQNRFMTIAMRAMAEELLDRLPLLSLSDEQLNQAMESFLFAMTPMDADRFSQFISIRPTNAHDRCWTARKLYNGASQDRMYGRILARLLIE